MFRRAIVFTMTLALAGAASADIRGDWQALANAVRATGQGEAATQIEQAMAQLSTEDLERVYGDVDLTELIDAMSRSAAALRKADKATGGTVTQIRVGTRGRPGTRSSAGFPDAQGYPSSPLPCPFSPDRSNADALLAAVDAIQVARVALEAAKVVWSGASRACDETIAGFNTSLVCIPVDIVLFAAELVVGLAESTVEHIKFCDDAVDAAEIEGSYERLGHLHTDWTSKFPGDIQVSRGGHGCNGIDDNGSGEIDECAEDTFEPFVHIDAAVANPWYRNLAEASAAVARGFHAIDECERTTATPPVIAGACDNVAASVTATDTCGNAATASTVVKVDGIRPVITIDPAVENACVTTVAAGEQAVLAATSLADDCTAVGELDFRLDSTVTECSQRVRQEAIDRAGNRSVAAVTVRADAERPTVTIERLLLGFRGEVLGFQTPACYDTVSQAEQAVLAVTRVQDNCSSVENIATSVASAGDPCSLEVTALGVDECTNDNMDAVTVRVDPAPPSITAATQTNSLLPGNHAMVDVGFSFSAADNCSGDLEIVHRVTSDEPTAQASGAGGSSAAPDAEILRDLDGVVQGIRLRAERATAGDGRVYEISVTATDPCGNASRASAFVEVRSQPGRAAVDSGQFYDATQVN